MSPTILLILSFSQLGFSFILAVRKPDGSVDIDSVVDHVTLLDSNMATVMQTTNTQKAEINRLKSEVATLTTGNTNLQNRVNILESNLGTGLTTQVASMKRELRATSTELKSVASQANTTATALRGLRSTVAGLDTAVSFQAQMVGIHGENRSHIQLIGNHVLPFKFVRFSTDNSYNPNTGMFTAPVSGIYLFWVTVDKVIGSKSDILLGHSSNSYAIAAAFSQATFDTSLTLTAATSMKAGERVYVFFSQNYSVITDVYSTFGGTLLHKL